VFVLSSNTCPLIVVDCARAREAKKTDNKTSNKVFFIKSSLTLIIKEIVNRKSLGRVLRELINRLAYLKMVTHLVPSKGITGC
jgi:hypothetical protein